MAKKIAEPKKEKLILATLEYENGTWELNCMLWDGVYGSGGRSIESSHSTRDAAVAEANRISEEYPNDREVVLACFGYGEEELHDKDQA